MQTTLKRGAKAELLRVRFAEVNRLLKNTDLTIEVIAEMTGFSYARYLQTSYRERYGISPGKFRRSPSQAP